LDRRAEIKEDYTWLLRNIFKAFPRIFSPMVPSEDQYKWAISIVRSKNIQITIGNRKQPALFPFMDMIRHIPQTESEFFYSFSGLDQTMYVRAMKDLEVGEELFLSFGEKCNSELLDYYGYIIEDNPNDCVHVELEILKSGHKKQMLSLNCDEFS